VAVGYGSRQRGKADSALRWRRLPDVKTF